MNTWSEMFIDKIKTRLERLGTTFLDYSKTLKSIQEELYTVPGLVNTHNNLESFRNL